MDPSLSALTLGSRAWVICEHHRIAQQGTVVMVDPEALTVRLLRSVLPPQRYDRSTGMWIPDQGPRRSNQFFLRSELPSRFLNGKASPPYVVLGEDEKC